MQRGRNLRSKFDFFPTSFQVGWCTHVLKVVHIDHVNDRADYALAILEEKRAKVVAEHTSISCIWHSHWKKLNREDTDM